MVGVFDSSVVNRGFEPRSGQTQKYEIGICCFSTKHTALRRKSKDWLDGITIMCPSSTKHVGLVQSGLGHHLIEN